MEMAPEWKLLSTMLGLALFGLAYNQVVAWLELKGYHRGYTAVLVVGGTIVTLAAAIPVVGWMQVLMIGLCFVASGTPMIIGSIGRHVRERAQEHQLDRQEVIENDQA
jgi:hypothetical protein